MILDIEYNDEYNFVYVDTTGMEIYFDDKPLAVCGLCFEGNEVRLVMRFKDDDLWGSAWFSLLKLYAGSSGEMSSIINALVLRWRALQKDTPGEPGSK